MIVKPFLKIVKKWIGSWNSGVNLKKKKKTWSLIEKDKKNDADGRQDRPEFDDSGVDDYDDYSEENFLSEIDALLAQPGTKKSRLYCFTCLPLHRGIPYMRLSIC